jgi:hypothetical protein
MPEAIKLSNGGGDKKLLELFDSSRIKKNKKSVYIISEALDIDVFVRVLCP